MPRPARTVNPTAKLKDSANTEAAQLSFQRKAVQDFHSRQTAKNNSGPASSSSTVVNPPAPSSVNVGLTPQNKRTISSINSGDDVEDGIVDQSAPRMSCFHLTIMFSLKRVFTAKKKHATATTLQAKSKGTESVTVGTIDVDMLDAEENGHANGMVFPNRESLST